MAIACYGLGMTETGTTTVKQAPVAAGACPVCGYVIALEGTPRGAKCPSCNTGVRLTWTAGSFNHGIPCDAACQYAIGPRCSCSCGGENHRRGYIHVELVPAWIRERDAKRADAKAARKVSKKEREQAAAAARTAHLLETHPELAELESDRYADDFGFMNDMKWALRHGRMTNSQLEAALRAIARDKAYDARKEAEAVAAAALVATGVKVPTGRIKFAGVIENVRLQDGFQGRAVWKMLVVHADGWKVWGSMPGSLVDAVNEERNGECGEAYLDLFRGRAVAVTATVEQSPLDALFGFMTRPVAQFTG